MPYLVPDRGVETFVGVNLTEPSSLVSIVLKVGPLEKCESVVEGPVSDLRARQTRN